MTEKGKQIEAVDEIAIILLAAGSSARMGQSKQQLLINGKSLLVHVAEIAIHSAVGKVVVVLGSEEKTHRHLLNDLKVDVIFNPGWRTGMGSSLKAGLNHVITNNPKTIAVIIMVCDQPLLTSSHINSIIQKYRTANTPIVASSYANTIGVPALFNRQLFGEILKLRDEEGAKKIILNHTPEVVDFPEGSIDLDTPYDYKKFIDEYAKKMS